MYKHGGTDVKAVVQKWGNSLGIRIPRALALEVSLDTNSEVDLVARDGAIVVTPLRQRKLSLRQLLTKVTVTNLHSEVATGDAEGGEAW
jgi:antitoxin MazE